LSRHSDSRQPSNARKLSGLYEALKGGVIGDPSLFELLERKSDVDLETVVRKAIRVAESWQPTSAKPIASAS
jgi:hypothetical protein